MKKTTAVVLFFLSLFFICSSSGAAGQIKRGSAISDNQKTDLGYRNVPEIELPKKFKQLEKKKEKSSSKGYCCRNGSLSKQKMEKDSCKGTFIEGNNYRSAKLSCLMMKKGYCCGKKANVYATSYGSCRNDGGEFFDDRTDARKSCDKKIKGYCCSAGKVDRKKVSSQECLEQRRGRFYKNIGYQSAVKRCAETIAGYCLKPTFAGKKKQYVLEERILKKDCKKQKGIFHQNKVKAQNDLRCFQQKLERQIGTKKLSNLNRSSIRKEKRRGEQPSSSLEKQIDLQKPTKEPEKKPVDIRTIISEGRFRLPDDDSSEDSPTSGSCEMELISPADTSNVSPTSPIELEVVLTGCDGVDRVEFLLDNFDYQLSGINYFQTESASAPPYRVVLPAPPPGDNINAWAAAVDDDVSPSYMAWLSFGISTTAPHKPDKCELRIISPQDGRHYNPGSPQGTVIGVKGCKSMTKLILTTHGPAWGTHHWVLTGRNLCSNHGSTILGGGSSLLSGERSYCLRKPQWQPPETSEYHSTLYANAWEGDTRLLGQTSVRFYVDDNTRVFNGTFRLP